MDDHWDAGCRVCYEGPPDTQSHRFGLTQPPCRDTHVLDDELGRRLHRCCQEHWTPDQEIYPPAMTHTVASILEPAAEPAWLNTTVRPHVASPLRPMVQIGPIHRIQGLHLTRIVHKLTPESTLAVITQINWERDHGLANGPPYGLILPRWFARAAFTAQPRLGQRDIWLAQQMGTD
jgi:hypothetical protein